MNVVAEHFEALQDGTAFAVGGIGASAYADGWAPILGSTPNTVTYNGNRNYDLVFNSVDLSSTLSPGQKLKLTRTVAAPDQCTDLEASSSQYYSKTSPAGMTFTDDFVCSAWIKLESYTESGIVSRYNSGTGNGFIFKIDSSGRVYLGGLNGSAANFSQVLSYQSIPLNKWVHVAAQLDMSAFTATTTTSYVMIDGVDVPAAVTRGGTNPTALVQSGDLNIGAQATTVPCDGKLAQVAIYSAKVTQATIKASCNQTLSGSETSLISAYSFDGVITDLNTTNANNLTANGSAVATNADSPFANAVTAGTQEYAEINSVTFSTNTTVNVRVPDTCMIPTSGGVSNVYYAVGANPYGLPAFSNVIGQVVMLASASTTTVSSFVSVSALTTTVYVPSNKKIRISGFSRRLGVSGAAQAVHMGIYEGATQLSSAVASAPASGNVFVPATTVLNPTSGSHTYSISMQQEAAGTLTFDAGATFPAYITVELV
jgi:hypothetical protein